MNINQTSNDKENRKEEKEEVIFNMNFYFHIDMINLSNNRTEIILCRYIILYHFYFDSIK